MTSQDRRFVTRGGDKLQAALDAFEVSPRGWVCADFGSNVGGFVDCLLQAGAAKVYAVDTGYGVLAWKLRRDPRVCVMERVNALHVALPEPVALVTIDAAWTPQRLIVPAALAQLAPGGRIISLIKPHYEAPREQLTKGVLEPADARALLPKVLDQISAAGAEVLGTIESPLPGGRGNLEFLALLAAQQRR